MQLLFGLPEDGCFLLVILADTDDCPYQRNVSHQSLLHGLSHRMLCVPLVWRRDAPEATSEAGENVSTFSLLLMLLNLNDDDNNNRFIITIYFS